MSKNLVDPSRPTSEWPAQLKSKCDFGHASVVELSRHRGYLAVGTLDGSSIVLDSETLTPQFRYRAHADRVRAISWSDDAKYVITVGDDWCSCVWETQRKAVICVHQSQFNPQAVAFDFEKFNRIASTCGPESCVADIPSDKDSDMTFTPYKAELGTATQPDFSVVAFIENGCLAAGTTKGQVSFFSNPTTVVRMLKASTGALRAMCYNAPGRMSAVACSDRAVRVVYFSWADTHETLEIGHKFSDWGSHSQWNASTFSEDGEYSYAASDMRDGTICIWNASTQTIVRHSKGSNERLTSSQFNQCRVASFATGRDTGASYVWRAHRPDAWASSIPGFERIADLEVYRETETSWDLPQDTNTIDLSKPVDIWTIEDPVKEVSLPLDI